MVEYTTHGDALGEEDALTTVVRSLRCESCGCGEKNQYGEKTYVRRRDEYGATICTECASAAHLDELEYRDGLDYYRSGPAE